MIKSPLLSNANALVVKQKDSCLLEHIEPEKGPTVCSFKKVTRNDIPFIVNLINCHSTKVNNNIQECSAIIEKTICFVNIELTNLHQYYDLFKGNYSNYCQDKNDIDGNTDIDVTFRRNRLRVNITLTSSFGALSDMTRWKLFENIEDYKIDFLILKKITLNSENLLYHLLSLSPRVRRIDIEEFDGKTDQINSNKFGALFNTGRFQYLEKVSIRNSKFFSIDYKTFYIDTNYKLKEVELINIELQEKVASSSFVIICNAAEYNKQHNNEQENDRNSTLKIKLENIKTVNRKYNFSFEESFLVLKDCSRETLKLDLVVNGNTLNQNFIPQSVFQDVIKDLYANSVTTFKYEPIDCCYESNKWLFELQASLSDNYRKILKKLTILSKESNLIGNQVKSNKTTLKKNSTSLNVFCSDLGNYVNDYSYSSISTYLDACNQRNVYPIFEIAISAVFLLAIFLGIFSFICFYYVLPKKDDVIMINNPKHGPLSSISSTNKQISSNESTTTRTTKGIIPISGLKVLKDNSNVIVLKTAQTDNSKNQPPLTSTDTKLLKQQSPIIKLGLTDVAAKLSKRRSNQSPLAKKSPKQTSSLPSSPKRSASTPPPPPSSPSVDNQKSPQITSPKQAAKYKNKSPKKRTSAGSASKSPISPIGSRSSANNKKHKHHSPNSPKRQQKDKAQTDDNIQSPRSTDEYKKPKTASPKQDRELSNKPVKKETDSDRMSDVF